MSDRPDEIYEDDECERSTLGEAVCLFPNECCMPGEHFTSECHTAEMMEAQEEEMTAKPTITPERLAGMQQMIADTGLTRDEQRELLAAVRSLQDEMETYDLLLKMQRKREQPWIERWRKAGPNRDLSLPDYGDMLQFITGAANKAEAESGQMRKVLSDLDTFWAEDFPAGPESAEAQAHFTDETISIWRTVRSSLAPAPDSREAKEPNND